MRGRGEEEYGSVVNCGAQLGMLTTQTLVNLTRLFPYIARDDYCT